MDVLKSTLTFLIVLSVLVVVHEWGHFIVAKLCGMRVEDFSLFFGKRLIRLGIRNGTEYNVRSVPLGGFVKIAGMEPEDISNGAPIFKRGDRLSTASVQARHRDFEKTLRGLREEALADVAFASVSERVRDAVDQAVGGDGRLTEDGRKELQALLAGTAINLDEHRYIEAILGAWMDEPDPNGYNQKPLWQRALVIFAGPFMSLFFGYVLFCVMGFTTGLPNPEHPAIETLIPGKPAQQAGLRPGDQIVAINGKKVDQQGMLIAIHDNPGRPLQLSIVRNSVPMEFNVTPYAETIEDKIDGKPAKKTIGRLGFMPGVAWERYTPTEAVRHGTQIIYLNVTMMLKTLFSRHVKDNIGGPIAIASRIHQDTKEGIRYVLLTAASLSVSLGIINLFPIPILDGGHLLLLAWEGIRRRKLSSREVYAAQMLGLSIIGVLFVLVMYNDIVRLVHAP